jgi:hypothetical protein
MRNLDFSSFLSVNRNPFSITLLFSVFLTAGSMQTAQAQYNNFDWGTHIDDDLNSSTGFIDEELIDGIAIDTSTSPETIYVVGRTKSFGVFNDTICDTSVVYYGSADAFVAKYSVDSAGACGAVQWIKMLGNPNGSDYGYCIALDYDSAAGKTYIYIGGDTKLLTNQDSIYDAFACSYEGCEGDVFQKERRDEWEGWIAKYDDAGTLLRWTLLGGNRNNTQAALDQVLSLAVDPVSHDVIATGFTESLNIGSGAVNTYDNKYNSKGDGYIAVLDPCLSTLKFFTYYDINNADTVSPKAQDRCHSVVIDQDRNIYISGTTESVDGIATSGTCQPKYKGGTDAFVGKWAYGVGQNGVVSYTPVWGSYIAGKSTDRGRGLALDDEGNVFMTGWTASNNFPTSSLAFQVSKAGYNDAFITKFDSVGKCVWSTFYGGSGDEQDNAILWYKNPNDPTDRAVFIIGLTNSANLPIKDPLMTYLNGNSSGTNTKFDAFIAAIEDVSSSTDTQTLRFATYLGGSREETNQQALSYGPFIAFGPNYELYFTFSTKSENVGLLSDADKIVVGYHTTSPANVDAFLGRLINTNDSSMSDCVSFPARQDQSEQQVFETGAVKYYPNPVGDQLQVQLNAQSSGEAVIRILDAYGRVMQLHQVNVSSGVNDLNVDFSNLVAGLYLMHIQMEGMEYALRVVKQL